MFTGIIEEIGEIVEIRRENSNLNLGISASLTSEIKVDQSISHNGICLTVTNITENHYEVTAISETLERTNLKNCKIGDVVNLERCLKFGGRLDGHIVQGHIDTTGMCISVVHNNGSWVFSFSYPLEYGHLLIKKGSICINGVSLTIVDLDEMSFSVAIIPYTYQHTNFKIISKGDLVNLEFDILGKYIAGYLSKHPKASST